MNNLFVANVSTYTKKGGELSEDKNGKTAVILNVISGRCPSKRIITGTMAENMGIEVGNTYTFSWEEQEIDENYGRQFTFTVLGKPTFLELMEASDKMAKPQVFDSSVKETVDEKKVKAEINSK